MKKWDIKITDEQHRVYHTVGYYLGSYFKVVRHCDGIEEAEKALEEYIQMDIEDNGPTEEDLLLSHVLATSVVFTVIADELKAIRQELTNLNLHGLRRRKKDSIWRVFP